MLPTICNEIKSGIVYEYLSLGMGAFLIYYPDLGLTDVPSLEEYNRRKYLTMFEASNKEVGGFNLSGYKRFIPRPDQVQITDSGPFVTIKIEPTFQAVEGSIGPFTHICLARNINTYQADSLNGNNRGDQQGKLILVKPVPVRPLDRIPNRPDIPPGSYGLVLEPMTTYKTDLVIQLNSRIFD